MDFSTWKPRAHFFGELMTEIRGKSNLQKYSDAKESFLKKQSEYAELESAEKLESKKADTLAGQLLSLEEKLSELRKVKDIPQVSKVCLKRLCKEFTKFTTGRERFISSFAVEKGLFLEEDAITQYSIFTGNYNIKNKIRKENDWVSGEIDIEEDERVTDTKVSLDLESFDALRLIGIKSIYEWQGRCYCWLWGKPEARVVHTLLNTPEHMIVSLERKLMYDMFGSEGRKNMATDHELEVYNEGCKKIRFNNIYDDLPIERKMRIFTIKRDESLELAMIKKVEDCRNILNNFDKIDVYDTED